MKIWIVSGVSVNGSSVSPISMRWMANTDAEAIGMTMKQMAIQAPTEPVARLWAEDVTEWAKEAVANLPS